MNLADKAGKGTGNNRNDAHNLLIQAGVISLQRRAAKMPANTDAPLPKTEQDFSAEIKTSRQTKYMRLSKWANYVWSCWIGKREFVSLEALREIQFIADDRYVINEATYKAVIR